MDADSRNSGNSGNSGNGSSSVSDSAGGKGVDAESHASSRKQPKTIRDHFMLLPENISFSKAAKRKRIRIAAKRS